MTLTHASTLLWDAYTEQTYNHARKIRIWITYLSSLLKSEIHAQVVGILSPLCVQPIFFLKSFIWVDGMN